MPDSTDLLFQPDASAFSVEESFAPLSLPFPSDNAHQAGVGNHSSTDEFLQTLEANWAQATHLSNSYSQPSERADLVTEFYRQQEALALDISLGQPDDDTASSEPISSEGTSLSQRFDPLLGYGLIDAAAAVGFLLGQALPDVPDLTDDNWGLDAINAPEVWDQGITGQDVIVAVIDDGVDINHPDLAPNIWLNPGEIADDGIDNDGNGFIDDLHGWNFAQGQNNNNVLPLLGGTHGTHVAGIIAATADGQGITGVAPDAKIMPIKIGDAPNNFFVNPGDLSAAIYYAVDNGANVINMSLGWPASPELDAALLYAASQNVIVVSSAGNSRNASPGALALYAQEVGLSVGAVNPNNVLASFSNGAGEDFNIRHITAPGVGILSTLSGGFYGRQSGTSMAAPHVAGAIALMLQANPNLNHAQATNLLISQSNRSNRFG
ncbi:S8 family serine peptidase [Leptolyngbya cf. ectocarpi LEGE 11479]|uniref:S8 family serine peptidase n=1 Tax=Leptolyngbya cf. ectocarpi LEGE 11479 TaxID=1828722 RepID=A0A928ZRU4_LEPEC|nr:S8 family peptidase [Leptolyngbya ectocarpi]MBE9067063.1 S8 family serine peptidase [Leptolyngbya cf. ectocarpi LEGE 11479]